MSNERNLTDEIIKMLMRWRIVSFDSYHWTEVEANEGDFFEFTSDERGRFSLGMLQGELDVSWHYDGGSLRFSWLGECEGETACGRGEFWLHSDDLILEGQLMVHLGPTVLLQLRPEQ